MSQLYLAITILVGLAIGSFTILAGLWLGFRN